MPEEASGHWLSGFGVFCFVLGFWFSFCFSVFVSFFVFLGVGFRVPGFEVWGLGFRVWL